MTASEAQKSWVTSVLGARLREAAGTAGPVDLPTALAAWRAALEAVDRQIAAVQNALRGAPDDELQEIAEFGLNAMTGSHKVKIQASLFEIERGQTDPRKLAAAATLVQSFLNHIGSDRRISACDANPFGVSMSLRQTLTPALTALNTSLRASAR